MRIRRRRTNDEYSDAVEDEKDLADEEYEDYEDDEDESYGEGV